MEYIIDKIIDEMKANDVLTEDEDIVRYGLEITITRTVFIIVIVLIGLLTKCLAEVAVFTVSYSLLRQYCGGFHAKSRSICFALSLLTLIIALIAINLVEVISIMYIPIGILLLAAVLYIFAAAPIDTANKRLDEDEIRVYGKRAKCLTAFLTLLTLLLWFAGVHNLACTVAVGVITESVLMLTGYIQNCRNGEAA